MAVPTKPVGMFVMLTVPTKTGGMLAFVAAEARPGTFFLVAKQLYTQPFCLSLCVCVCTKFCFTQIKALVFNSG